MSTHVVWYLYIIRSTKTDHLYTGIAKDVNRRLATHNAGRGARFTKGKGPWVLVYQETISENVGDALRRERAVKKLSRIQKMKLAKLS